jgi:hypothetical protein
LLLILATLIRERSTFLSFSVSCIAVVYEHVFLAICISCELLVHTLVYFCFFFKKNYKLGASGSHL